MLRTTLSKIKRVCTIVIVPRILQGDAKYVQKKITKNSMIASRATKSTSSSNTGSKDDTEQNTVEKHIQILERTDQNVNNKYVSQTPDDNCEVCNRIIGKIFEKETVSKPLEATVNATNKSDGEELAQKMEKLEETPVVLTPSKFQEQTTPRVLGNQILNASKENELPENTTYDSSFDEIAKKCLRVPPNEVDECILKELRQYYEHSKGNVYEKTPIERYYSQGVYNPQQIINLGKVNSVMATDVSQNVLQNLKEETNEENIWQGRKAEIIQPLLFDSVSVYGVKADHHEYLLEIPNFEPPLLLNPYDNNLIFPLDGYVLKEDMLIEAPLETTEAAAVPDSEVGKNEAMPPAEMEIETEQPGLGEQLQGAGISLGVPEDITASESKHTSQMTGMQDGYVYTRSREPPTDPPPDWQTQIGQHNERQPIVPNTSISGKLPEMERKRRQQTSDSAISSHQNLHDLYMIGINRDVSESLLKSKPQLEPETEHQEIKNAEIARQNFESKIAATGTIADISQETNVPLQEMLRRIRERHRQELCRDLFQQSSQIHLSTSCKPKIPFPGPCKTIPKEETKSECPPPKCPEKKDPCAPKKDPCAKFTHLQNQICNSICFIRFSLNNFGNTHARPIINYQPYKQYSQAMSTVQIHCLNGALKEDSFEDIYVENVDVILARDYEPWTPIPSWPLPKKEEKRKLVCPKEGCRLLPPPPPNPAQKDKPCVTFPKRTFSLVEIFEQPLTSAPC